MNDKTATEKIIKAIDILKQQERLICNDCAHPAMVGWCENHCRLSEAFDMAVDAMKKQIPVKPVKSKDPRYGMGYEYYDWECPTCGGFLAPEPARSGDHHCKCGQAIDWEVESDQI